MPGGNPERPNPHPSGSAFFKWKLDRKCFNCFSPEHRAWQCRDSARCWRCYRSGHKASACPSTRVSAQLQVPLPNIQTLKLAPAPNPTATLSVRERLWRQGIQETQELVQPGPPSRSRPLARSGATVANSSTPRQCAGSKGAAMRWALTSPEPC